MIDSHVHLNHRDFKKDFDAVLSRAREAGVTGMVNIGFDLESSRETAAYVERYPFMYGAVGVHPHDAVTYNDEVEGALSDLLDKPGIIAVGEIGLDFYRDLSPRDTQRAVFKRQLALARAKQKPVIIHCRDAFEDVLKTLAAESESYRGIFHAFSGDSAMARDVMSLGFHIGVGGVVTFKNAKLPGVVASIPMTSIVLETDCPYLTPMPFRGKRNEPAYVVHIAEAVAAATRTTRDKVADITTENFKQATGLKKLRTKGARQ
ncbi:MAG: TatD family hydrolase [Candidatus Latescibacterota bacterium]|nr:MAG: TatD family hydrolase [Candidatus Latescibacterota bacterium]